MLFSPAADGLEYGNCSTRGDTYQANGKPAVDDGGPFNVVAENARTLRQVSGFAVAVGKVVLC